MDITKVLGVSIGVILFVAFEMGIVWLLMVLWNALIPGVFHGPHLTYWQMLIAYILLTIIAGIFKSSVSKGR